MAAPRLVRVRPSSPGGRQRPSLPAVAVSAAGGGSARLQCAVCGRSFRSESSWYQHRRTHQGLTQCPVCGRRLSRVFDLRRHLVTTHAMQREQADAAVAAAADWAHQ